MAEPTRVYARRLTSILVEAGVVTSEQVDAGLSRQRTTGRKIGESLVEMGVATEEDIGWALAHQLDLTFVDLSLACHRFRQSQAETVTPFRYLCRCRHVSTMNIRRTDGAVNDGSSGRPKGLRYIFTNRRPVEDDRGITTRTEGIR